MNRTHKTMLTAAVMAVLLFLQGCRLAENAYTIHYTSDQQIGSAPLTVTFEGNVNADFPFFILDASEKVLASGPQDPCPSCNGGLPALALASLLSETIEEWFWDFGECCGDDNFATGQVVTHTYTQPGCYTPTLVVRFSSGQTLMYQEICFINVD